MNFKKVSLLFAIVGMSITLKTGVIAAGIDLDENTPFQEIVILPDSTECKIEKYEHIFYCSAKSGLNIRESCSVDSKIIGGYKYGEAVTVKGKVYEEDKENEWVMVQAGKKTGYVYKSYLSEDPLGYDEVIKLINNKGEYTTVYKLTDGAYMDRIERRFSYDGYDNWMCDDGSVWSLAYESVDVNEEIDYNDTKKEDVVELIDAKGDTTTAYLLADGSYMDRIDRTFYYDGNETWNCTDGTQWNKTVN